MPKAPSDSFTQQAKAPRFELDRVGRQWGSLVAVNDVSLSIEPGERIAVIGPSGGGKSTLLQLLSGSLRSTSGHVLVEGTPLSQHSPKKLRDHRSRCGMVVQSSLMLPHLSVHQNMVSGLLPHWPWWRVIASSLWPVERVAVSQWLERVGLERRQWDRASVLSGGEQQRIAVARTLIANPSVLLADEPTASLDPATSEMVARLLFEEVEARNATMVWCTHWFSRVRSFVTRVLGVREGQIVLDAAVQDVTEETLQRLYQGTEESVR